MEPQDLSDYFGLVTFYAQRVYRRLLAAGSTNIELPDLIQEGMLGLLEAWDRYEPGTKSQFASFASYRITGSIRDYLRRLDPLTQTQRSKLKDLDVARAHLAHVLQREPCRQELAQHLSISEEELNRRMNMKVTVVPLSEMTPQGFDDGKSCDFLPANEAYSPENLLLGEFNETERKRLSQNVADCLTLVLDDMERSILIARVIENLPLNVVGRLWDTSKDTIARRERKAKSKMKECLETKGWQVSDIVELTN